MAAVPDIERFLHTSYDQFATKAAVANVLPLLAERFARQRLHASARVEGDGEVKGGRSCGSWRPSGSWSSYAAASSPARR
ncbi:hypothetical protein AB0C33_50125 [Nonomuraea sp. NPDC048881]|uniref:three-helix bundle dimerization domain-containing protein n=1 Tax=Nonomuraea sp. NPDC048881 TaxID=3155030 RepID=UPI0033EB1A06